MVYAVFRLQILPLHPSGDAAGRHFNFCGGSVSWPRSNSTNDVRAIEFPDTASYQTLVVDLHTHSVFSDGHVWPKIRVEEALRDRLDALAITEHLEYQPHRADILHPDRNRAYDIAADAAKDSDLIVIRGSEITRDAPAGHINAVFIDDANKLIKVDKPPADTSDVLAYYSAAKNGPHKRRLRPHKRKTPLSFGTIPTGLVKPQTALHA